MSNAGCSQGLHTYTDHPLTSKLRIPGKHTIRSLFRHDKTLRLSWITLHMPRDLHQPLYWTLSSDGGAAQTQPHAPSCLHHLPRALPEQTLHRTELWPQSHSHALLLPQEGHAACSQGLLPHASGENVETVARLHRDRHLAVCALIPQAPALFLLLQPPQLCPCCEAVSRLACTWESAVAGIALRMTNVTYSCRLQVVRGEL